MDEILFLAHRIPYPPDRGDRIRSFHILQHLAKLRPVHLVGFVDSAEDRQTAKAMLPMLASLHIETRSRSTMAAGLQSVLTGVPVSVAAFGSRHLQAAVDRLLADRPIGTIFVYSGQMAQFVPADVGGRRFIMDFVDVDSEKFATYGAAGRGPMAWIHRREARLLARFERDVAQRADVSLFVTEAEAALFRDRTGLGPQRIVAMDNGIDLGRFCPESFPHIADPEPLIVFTGQMDYRPNIEAVDYFARRTFPAIRAKHPSTMFAIVGRNPTPTVRKLAELKGVMVTGEVADVRPWIAAATVVVAPLEIARGVQNKVLEAMAMGRPVVASAAAFKGIDATPGTHLLVAEGYEMANAVSRLIADPLHAAEIGRAGRQRMVARYAWEAQLGALDMMIGAGTN
ncbi:MAG: glycosyl transferase family 1 [Rhizorhabdus sp.]|nr:glycosyl transferase family 1 [Rhizorhabdus sp.]